MKYLSKLFSIILILIGILLLRYELYKYNIIKVNYIKYDKKFIEIEVNSDIQMLSKKNDEVEFYFINKSFVTLFNKANISYLLKKLNVQSFLFLTNNDIIISFSNKIPSLFTGINVKNIDTKLWKKLKIKKIYSYENCDVFKNDKTYQIYLKSGKYRYISLIPTHTKTKEGSINKLISKFCKIKE